MRYDQWFKNGDHPDDFKDDRTVFENGEIIQIPGEYAASQGWEGNVVRRFRHPSIDGNQQCPHCGHIMHVHGWIDEGQNGYTVCPGDFIITLNNGSHVPCKPELRPFLDIVQGESDHISPSPDQGSEDLGEFDYTLSVAERVIKKGRDKNLSLKGLERESSTEEVLASRVVQDNKVFHEIEEALKCRPSKASIVKSINLLGR